MKISPPPRPARRSPAPSRATQQRIQLHPQTDPLTGLEPPASRSAKVHEPRTPAPPHPRTSTPPMSAPPARPSRLPRPHVPSHAARLIRTPTPAGRVAAGPHVPAPHPPAARPRLRAHARAPPSAGPLLAVITALLAVIATLGATGMSACRLVCIHRASGCRFALIRPVICRAVAPRYVEDRGPVEDWALETGAFSSAGLLTSTLSLAPCPL